MKKMLDDVINDVTRPGSKIREEELFSLGRGPSCLKISSIGQEMTEKKHFEKPCGQTNIQTQAQNST